MSSCHLHIDKYSSKIDINCRLNQQLWYTQITVYSLTIYGYIYTRNVPLFISLYLGHTILSLTAVSFSLPSLLAVLILQCRSLADLYFVPPYYQLIRAETRLSLFIYILISLSSTRLSRFIFCQIFPIGDKNMVDLTV